MMTSFGRLALEEMFWQGLVLEFSEVSRTPRSAAEVSLREQPSVVRLRLPELLLRKQPSEDNHY